MAKRQEKNSKDEWRRKKKLREAAAKPGGTETFASFEEVKAKILNARRGLDSDVQAEFDNLMDQEMGRLESGEAEGPPFYLNFQQMIDSAKRITLARKNTDGLHEVPVDVSSKMHRKLSQEAQRQGVSVEELATKAVKKGLDSYAVPQQTARQYTPKKRAKPEEESVDTYLRFLSFALGTSRTERDPDRRAVAL